MSVGFRLFRWDSIPIPTALAIPELITFMLYVIHIVILKLTPDLEGRMLIDEETQIGWGRAPMHTLNIPYIVLVHNLLPNQTRHIFYLPHGPHSMAYPPVIHFCGVHSFRVGVVSPQMRVCLVIGGDRALTPRDFCMLRDPGY